MNSNYLMIFEKNTDAFGTNRGFLYQYLLTLKEWINNYIEKNNKIIFCETEDDLKEVTELDEVISFKQMKCYSRPLGLNSEEIKKSLYNFFTLYLKYECDKIESFEFITNTTITSTDMILKKWTSNNEVKDSKDELVIEIKKILESIFIEEALSKVNSTNKMIKRRKDKLAENKDDEKLKKEIEELEDKIIKINESKETLISKVNDDSIILSFIRITIWKFEAVESNKVIDVLKDDCIKLIKKMDKASLSPNIILCRLLTEICCKSTECDIEKRILSIDLMNNIISESEDEIMSKQSASLFLLLDNRFDKLEDILKNIKEEIGNLCNDKNKPLEDTKYYYIPYYEEDEIENLIRKEDEKRQSNLENKIDKIELKPEDNKNLKDIAREYRCSYLLYLDSLRVSNLEQEFGTIKNLERDVKSLCFEAVQNIQEKEEFNPNKFWNDFKNQLELKAKEYGVKRKCDIDNSIVYGQMYQMAAECPLRWHK